MCYNTYNMLKGKSCLLILTVDFLNFIFKRRLFGSMSDSKNNSNFEEFDLNNYRRTNDGKTKGKKPAKKKRKIKRSKKEKIIRTILATFMLCVIIGCMAIGGFLIYAFNFVDSSLGVDLEAIKSGGTTTIYVKDASGNWVEYQRINSGENRIWKTLDEIPDTLENAFIAIEDKRFRTHGGVDWKRTFAAFANTFLHFYSSNQGGSTITQQLVKNITGDNEQDWSRKLREIMRARELEMTESKDTILECYLNIVGMGNNISGVEVAANYYFNKTIDELTLSECASLASITKSPEALRPDKNLESNKKRRDVVLDQMYDQGYITAEEHKAAKEEELVVVANSSNIKQVAVNNYFVDALIDQLINDLMVKYNYERSFAELLVYNGGYRIYSTLNPDIQNNVDTVFSDAETYGIKASNGATMQGAITVMDYSGHIVAMSGGIGEKQGNRGLNRATQISRQPGSTMKPIAAYAPALDSNIITYSTLIDDKYTKYGSWNPVNWYGGYWGPITAQYALERSVNTVPVYLVNKLTPEKSYNFIKESLGISTLVNDDMNLSALGMGGTHTGLNTTQSAAAFAIFGNMGKYYQPTTYYYVTDSAGNTVLEYAEKGTQVIGQDTATVMNYMLRSVVYGANGTGGGASGYIPNMKIYAKTGTSDATKDLWFVGGSPYYVASCWCGYDNNETIKNEVIAQRMWGKVMTPTHKGLEAKKFEDSQYISSRYYCNETGLVATENCANVSVGYYKNSYIPTCSLHEGALLSPISGSNKTMDGKNGIVKGKVTVTIEQPKEESSEQSSSDSSSDSSSSDSSSSSSSGSSNSSSESSSNVSSNTSSDSPSE